MPPISAPMVPSIELLLKDNTSRLLKVYNSLGIGPDNAFQFNESDFRFVARRIVGESVPVIPFPVALKRSIKFGDSGISSGPTRDV